VTFRYFRRASDQPYTRLDGSIYLTGDIITDRPVHMDNPASVDFRLGSVKTLIDLDKSFAAGGTYNPGYVPVLEAPVRFE